LSRLLCDVLLENLAYNFLCIYSCLKSCNYFSTTLSLIRCLNANSSNYFLHTFLAALFYALLSIPFCHLYVPSFFFNYSLLMAPYILSFWSFICWDMKWVRFRCFCSLTSFFKMAVCPESSFSSKFVGDRRAPISTKSCYRAFSLTLESMGNVYFSVFIILF